MFNLHFVLLVTFLGIIIIIAHVNTLDTTTCSTSGWFYPKTCSPIKCPKANNTACTANATVNMTIIEQSISSMTCNASIIQSSNPICKNASLIQTFKRGMVGQGIVAVYCTDKFLVIFTNDIPNHPLNLMDVPHPPSGSATGGYTGCVTRYNLMQFNAYKIPLNPVDLNMSTLDNNNQIGNQSMFVFSPQIFKTPILGTSPLKYYPIPAEGTVGVTINGIGLKVPYSQNGFQSWEECSLDNCNGHVPIGNGYHYHGDPYDCMYNQSDYPTIKSHPPLIGFGLDGFSIYGRYLDVSAPGANISLDLCGGHSHSPYGYHYHTEVKKINATDSGQQIPLGTPYYIFLPGITNCWRGDISKIDGFWNGISGSNNLKNRADYPYLQPPCSMTDWYIDPNIKLNIGSTTTTTTTAKTTSTTTAKTTTIKNTTTAKPTTTTAKQTTAKTTTSTKPVG